MLLNAADTKDIDANFVENWKPEGSGPKQAI